MYDNKTIIELANLSQKSAQELTQQIKKPYNKRMKVTSKLLRSFLVLHNKL
jgi:hypothetical protein